MEIIVQPSAEHASRLAARLVADTVRSKPDAVLGLATGSTPVPLYRELIRLHREEALDFSRVTTFNLDEYVGLDRGHACSYRRFMEDNLFRHVNLKPENTHVPDGMSRDIPGECRRYEERIQRSGGIDLQILGIGSDGHIGFNEPTSSLASRTRIKTLTQTTRRDNARFFDDPDDVPKHCITMGVGTILESRTIVMLAFGAQKASVIGRAVEGPLSAMVPASAMQIHPTVKVFLDEAAAAQLTRRDYYDWVYANKPDWQRF